MFFHDGTKQLVWRLNAAECRPCRAGRCYVPSGYHLRSRRPGPSSSSALFGIASVAPSDALALPCQILFPAEPEAIPTATGWKEAAAYGCL